MDAESRESKFARRFMPIFVGVFLALLWLLVYWSAQDGAFWTAFAVAMPMTVVFVGLTLLVLYEPCGAWLDENGVTYRQGFRQHFLGWKEIPQAGILCVPLRYGYQNTLVLLKPGVSPRKYRERDISFTLRNTCRLIELANTEAVRSYVVAHYGPLDFDLSDGKPEQIIVVGSCLRDDTPWE